MNTTLFASLVQSAVLLLFCGPTLLGCATQSEDSIMSRSNQIAAFETDLLELKSRLGVPGIAYIIVEDGDVIATNEFGHDGEDSASPYTSTTLQDLASIAKIFVATLLKQLEDDGRIDLSDPVTKYAPDLEIPDDVTLQHILTHTSEGIIGQEYVYGTTRFGMLVRVIESVTNQPFETTLKEKILEPAGMQFYPSPGGTSSMWMFSTLQEMTKLLKAFDSELLLSAESHARLATPSRDNDGRDLPNSLGWFTQEIQGERVMWSYGHDDETGALLIRLPDHKLSLYMHSNSVNMSDSDRLLMGDLRRSALANSFLRLFVFSDMGAPILRPDFHSKTLAEELDVLEASHDYRFQDEILSYAQVDLSTGRNRRAASLYEFVNERYGFDKEADPVTHFYLDVLDPSTLVDEAIALGNALLDKFTNNRWILRSQASLLAKAGDENAAVDLYRRVLELPNQQDDRLHNGTDCWTWLPLSSLLLEKDPAQAKRYLNRIVNSPQGCSGRQTAESMLAQLK